jgi:hypothetical protein
MLAAAGEVDSYFVIIKMGVMLRLSKHGGEGLCARPFDRFRVTGFLT